MSVQYALCINVCMVCMLFLSSDVCSWLHFAMLQLNLFICILAAFSAIGLRPSLKSFKMEQSWQINSINHKHTHILYAPMVTHPNLAISCPKKNSKNRSIMTISIHYRPLPTNYGECWLVFFLPQCDKFATFMGKTISLTCEQKYILLM